MRFHSYGLNAHLQVTGDDAFTFLQGQFTNQLQQPEGSCVYGLWLNQKGKVLADSFVMRLAPYEFRVTSVGCSAGVIRERLEAYIIADDVQITDDTAEVAGLALLGTGSGEVLARIIGHAAPAAGQFARVGEVIVFSGRQISGENYELVGPVSALADYSRQLSAMNFSAIGADELNAGRIVDGIPAIPGDIGPTDLPNEGELEGIAISYTKGCYLGQEVMARLKNLGQVRRKLHSVRGAGEPPASSTPLYQGAEKVGEVRTSAKSAGGFVAMAMLSLVRLKPGVGLSLSPGGEPSVEVIARG
ncbi:CAF17-like 4Fe-4S cluster assembly/insertion protein YgfZ [Oleiharenicola lentus]|uniref:CAF17-like 4Fe-4S cluster assembly/insertion protein YgfZ n=1 Tax=Oleiharenicola lentus TaxID=2508720 RepID=UPI003F681F7D